MILNKKTLVRSIFTAAALWATQHRVIAGDGTGEAGFDPSQFEDKDGSKAANGFKSILGPDGVQAGQLYAQRQADLANAIRQQNVWDAEADTMSSLESKIGLTALRDATLSATLGPEAAEDAKNAIDAAEGISALKDAYETGNVGELASQTASAAIDQMPAAKAIPMPIGTIAVEGTKGIFSYAGANLASFAISKQYQASRPQVSK